MITHNEITALLWLLVAASSGTTGLLIGRYHPGRRLLDDEFDRAYKLGADAGYSGGYDDGRYDERQARAEEQERYVIESDGIMRYGPVQPVQADELRFDYDYTVRRADTGELVFAKARTYDDITPLAMSLDALEPGELPAPPADLRAWWAAELNAVVSNGQSDWYTTMAGL